MSMGPSDDLFLYLISRAVFLLAVLFVGALLFYIWDSIEACSIGKFVIGMTFGVGLAGFVKALMRGMLR